ncbi:carboxymuconolactone decarboxylase family protein [Pseudomonas lalucatii]|uniref:Carboxymuconolactone decarboxylase family protein n=1 Tax=Pseudomonas lalucatii TaxID=1424203 RepID=A0ABS5Q1D5_9PSED|nr:carboxymuconolactone decarboxylase family protein [Pseudomonas lalucatii]MBS7662103.1 carboxymuconolactone decarboxylase family protein [Pseudomonas lalucatii]
MPRIAPLDLSHADSQTAAALAAAKGKLGMLPNLFTTLAQAPAALHGYLNLADTLGRGRLNARQREVVALAVAQANGCGYCLSAHSLLGKGAGLNGAELLAARAGRSAEGEQPIAELALRLLERRGRLSDAELLAAREAGLDDGLILEVVAQVALNVLTNFTNNLAHTDIDFPPVSVAL